MRDYLDRLVRGVQKPEFAVQPRPVSRFESPPHLILEPSDLSAPGEPSEPGPQSEHFIPTETSAVQSRQHTDGIHRNEAKIVEPISEAWLTNESHKPYPGQSATDPPIVAPIGRAEGPNQPVQKLVQPALHGRFTKQSEPIARREKEPIEPTVRIEKPARAVGMTSSNPARGREPFKLNTHVVQGDPGRVYPPAEIQEQARPLDIPVFNLMGIQERAELKELVLPGEQGGVRPLAKIGKLEEKSASPLSASMSYHRDMGLDRTRPVLEPLFHQKMDLPSMLDVAPLPGREKFKLFTENTAPRFSTEPVADSPTIQVTIGRVEIRATVASTPTRKPPAKSSAMSLDDYLTRRTEGRR